MSFRLEVSIVATTTIGCRLFDWLVPLRRMAPATPPSDVPRSIYPPVVRESLMLFADPDSLAPDPVTPGSDPPPHLSGSGFELLFLEISIYPSLQILTCWWCWC